MPILGKDSHEKASIVAPPIEIGDASENPFGLIEDSLAMDLVTTTMNSAEFKIKLKQEFARLYCPNETQLDNINVNKFESTKKTANQDCHFIIEYKGKKYHVKPALHGSGVSNNCRYNEAAMYFLLDKVGYGPHVESSVINDVLIIFSEDLSYRSSPGKTDKKTSFKDNIQENLLKTISERQKDNIHRCAIDLLINLFSLGDLENNLGNSGVKTSKTIDGTEIGRTLVKQKPFIVDFTIMSDTEISRRASPDNCEAGLFFPDPNSNMVSKVDSARIFADKIASNLDNEQDNLHSLFSFRANRDIFQQAIKMLFFDKDIKTLINFSFNKAKSIVVEDDLSEKERSIKELNKQQETLLQCIDAFLKQENIDLLMKEEGGVKEASLKKKSPEPSPLINQEQHTSEERIKAKYCKSQRM